MDRRSGGLLRRQSSHDRSSLLLGSGGGGAAAAAAGTSGGILRPTSDVDILDPMMTDQILPTKANNDDVLLLSDDDNAAPEMSEDSDLLDQQQQSLKEDPLLVAIDDLEGRVITALDDVKLHPGVRTSSSSSSSSSTAHHGGGSLPTVHEELATLLRPVLEIASHVGPSVARSCSAYRSSGGGGGIEETCDVVYNRINSDLILPVVLEMSQSDTMPAKRAAALEFFHSLWKECHKAGSWLDNTTTGPNAGPYGVGGGTLAVPTMAPGVRALIKRRQARRLVREGELLRYWVQASIACTIPGTFTNVVREGAVASRGVIAASGSLRPSLRHIAQRIRDADDRGAARLYGPVMKMIEGVLRKLFLDYDTTNKNSGGGGGGGDTSLSDALRSACVKFLEIVVLCFSSRAQPGASQGVVARRRE